MNYKPVPFDDWPQSAKDHLIRDIVDGKPSPPPLDDRLPYRTYLEELENSRDTTGAPIHDPMTPRAVRLQMMEHVALTKLQATTDEQDRVRIVPRGSYELSSEEEDALLDADRTAGLILWAAGALLIAVGLTAWGVWSHWSVITAHWGGK